jgi:S-adenosylmethionine:tRNA ribosyltransferase-isomerase
MIVAASRPVQRPADARLIVVDRDSRVEIMRRADFLSALRPGDLVIANDAATLPASLAGTHVPSGSSIEVRLASRRSLESEDVRDFGAIVFGEGDFHTRTEDRPAPPPLDPGDHLALGPLSATVRRILGHPRLIDLRFDGSADAIWSGLSRHGRPIQYAHVPEPLAIWDVWSPIAGPPVAFEPPSAGFALDWRTVLGMRARQIEFETLTHAAGISSTGDPALDARLPFDEPYDIPPATASALARARSEGRRIVAIGTTVVRALEHAAAIDGSVHAGRGLANQRISRSTALRVVDAILSGVHEVGSSHYELLRAFANDETLGRVISKADEHNFRAHEFGESVFVESLTRPT